MSHLLALAMLMAQGQQELLTPDGLARLALLDLSLAAPQDAVYYRYLSLHAVPEADLERWRRNLGFWLHAVSGTLSAITLPVEVKGSQGRLLRVSIIDYSWNAAAWRAVAKREPYFREPIVGSAVAALLREAIREVSDVQTFHVFAVVRADWLVREISETLRSTSYYDLLYADFRFPKGGPTLKENVKAQTATQIIEQDELISWPGGQYIDPKTNKLVPYFNERTKRYENEWPPGSFKYTTGKKIKVEIPGEAIKVIVEEAKVVDFPANKKDWDKAHGIDKLNDFFKESKKQVRTGAIALGMGDDPTRGSYVTRNNRLLTFEPSPSCLGGASLESYDVIDPVGERDYVQQAPNLARGKIVKDAQELLNHLPNGCQAAFITNGVGDRVEAADPAIAVATVELAKAKAAGITRKLDARVRTPGSCVVCHAANNGIINPGRLVDDFYNTDLKNPLIITDPIQRLEFRSFYFDWQDKIDALRTPMKLMIKKSTASFKVGAKEWTGVEVSNATYDGNAWYDLPLGLPQVLVENGLTVPQWKKIVALSTKSAWIPLLDRGEKNLSRRAYEVDVVPEIIKLAALTGSIPTLIK